MEEKKEEDKKEKQEEEKEEEEKKNVERSIYSLEGAKLPLSIYSSRVMDISKINYYLESSSSNGKCGEHYLGNICFMNSSIVCYRINIILKII